MAKENNKDNDNSNSFAETIKRICIKIGTIVRRKKKCSTVLGDGEEYNNTAPRG